MVVIFLPTTTMLLCDVFSLPDGGSTPLENLERMYRFWVVLLDNFLISHGGTI